MSDEDRLLGLLIGAQHSGGDTTLTDAPALAARLTGQAPDLHGEIRALAAALAGRAPSRIAAAPDRAAERRAVAGEIAASERLPMATVDTALEVLLLSGIDPARGGATTAPAPAPSPPPAAGGWAGDSVLVGGGGAPAWAPQPEPVRHPTPDPVRFAADPVWHAKPEPAKPLWEQTWFYAVLAALILGTAFYFKSTYRPQQVVQQGEQPQGPQQPQNPQVPQNGQQGPQQGPQGSGPQTQPQRPESNGDALAVGGPLLSAEQTGLPRLPIKRAATGALGIGFSISTAEGPVNGLVVLPPNGWDAGEGTIVGQGANAASLGAGRFNRSMIDGAPVRVMTPTWKQDGLGVGRMCVGLRGQTGQQDVDPAGAMMCLTDSTCTRPVGCGIVQ